MISLSIWLGGEHYKEYIVDAVPNVGHIFALDRKINVIVTHVVWSLNRIKLGEAGYVAHAPDPDSDLNSIDVYVREATEDECPA